MPTPRKIARYGWEPDSLDHRDHWMTVAAPVAIPATSDLRGICMPPVYDQGQLGSCTANAIAAAIDFKRKKQGESFIFPSRLLIYYNERVIEGSVNEDAGAEIRDGIKSVAAMGVCPESEWPYDVAKFDIQPPANCYADAVQFEALSYSRVTQSLYYLRHCPSILGLPVVFGFSVFDPFESDQVAKTGIVPMPGPNDQPIGGHATVICGHDDAKRMFLVRNSWSAQWGIGGYFWLPYDYVTNPDLASDFWTILAES